jgi:hypothetical protein
MRIIDPCRSLLHAQINPDAVIQAGGWIVARLDDKIKRNIQRPVLGEGNTCSAWLAHSYLETCWRLIASEVVTMARRYASLQWLWYLRRLPDCVFTGYSPEVHPFKATLAETLSDLRQGTNEPPSMNGDILAYPIEGSDIRNILEFCMAVAYLAEIDALRRSAGKNTDFIFDEGALPVPSPTPDQQAAIELYDSRALSNSLHTLSHRPLSRVGTAISSYRLYPDALNDPSCLLSVYRTRDPRWLSSRENDEPASQGDHEVYVRFNTVGVSYEDLSRLNSDPRLANWRWWPPEVGVLLLLLRALWILFSRDEHRMYSMLQFGYMAMNKDELVQAIDPILSDASVLVRKLAPGGRLPSDATRLLSLLYKLRGSLFPVPCGPVIRRAGNILCVDVYSATIQLHNLLQFPRIDGERVHARTADFELKVQDVVNASPWRPGSTLAGFRGREIRHAGRNITDLDAVGEQDDMLLIVSCKSYVECLDYAAGEHRVVRSTAQKTETAVAEWQRVKAHLEAHPRGANYDFTRYRCIIAVVCVPFPVYVPLGSATQFVASDLRAVCSIEELSHWLHTST